LPDHPGFLFIIFKFFKSFRFKKTKNSRLFGREHDFLIFILLPYLIFFGPVFGNKKITLFNPKSHNIYLPTGFLAFGTLSFAFPAFAASGFY
jgi:hypothetical protein